MRKSCPTVLSVIPSVRATVLKLYTCQNSSTCKNSPDTIKPKMSNGCILLIFAKERIEHTVFKIPKAEISRVQVVCTDLSVDTLHHLSKLYVQFESSSNHTDHNPCSVPRLSSVSTSKIN